MLDIFSRAAHAPKMNVFVNAALLGFIPRSVKKGLMSLAPVRRIRNAVGSPQVCGGGRRAHHLRS